MRKLLGLLMAASVAMSGGVVLLGGSAAIASSPASTTLGYLGTPVLTNGGAGTHKGDHNDDDGYCNGPSIEVYANGRGYKDDQGNIVVQKGSRVSVKVITHCVDGSNTIWALHHGWSGDQNFYIFPDGNGTYGGDGDQQYTITFIAANRECDARLRSLPRDDYNDGQRYDNGPYNEGNQSGPQDNNCPCDNDRPGSPRGGNYVPNAYGGGGDNHDGGNNGDGGRYGFKDIPECCHRLGDVNFRFVDHYEHHD
jgi:hypothetical protein